jgi:hypothetical protein
LGLSACLSGIGVSIVIERMTETHEILLAKGSRGARLGFRIESDETRT